MLKDRPMPASLEKMALTLQFIQKDNSTAFCRKVRRLHEHTQFNGGPHIVCGVVALVNVREPLLKGQRLIGWNIGPGTPLDVVWATSACAAQEDGAIGRSKEQATCGTVGLDGKGREGIDEAGFNDAKFAVRVAQRDRRIVLHRAPRDVAVAGADAFGQAQKEVCEVQRMRAEVNERSTCRLLRIEERGRQPTIRISTGPERAIVRQTRPYLRQLTEQLAVEDAFDRQCRAAIEPGQRNHQPDARLLDGGNNFVRLMQCWGKSLFGKDMLAGLRSSDHHSTMHRRWCIDDDRMNIGSRQQIAQLIIEGHPQSRRLSATASLILVPDRNDLRGGIVERLVLIIMGMDMPEAEHSDSERAWLAAR